MHDCLHNAGRLVERRPFHRKYRARPLPIVSRVVAKDARAERIVPRVEGLACTQKDLPVFLVFSPVVQGRIASLILSPSCLLLGAREGGAAADDPGFGGEAEVDAGAHDDRVGAAALEKPLNLQVEGLVDGAACGGRRAIQGLKVEWNGRR